jgi:uncharacterized protein YeeX (DUF496 family)
MSQNTISKRIRDEIDKSTCSAELKKLLKDVFEGEVMREVGYQYTDTYEKLIEAYAKKATEMSIDAQSV